MKPVKGFTANDGTFFESEGEAELYEADEALEVLCESHGIDPTAFKSMVIAAHEQTMRYINAYQAQEKIIHDAIEISRETPDWYDSYQNKQRDATDVSSSIDTGTEIDATSVQQQPPSRREHVRQVGRRQLKENVSKPSKGDGP